MNPTIEHGTEHYEDAHLCKIPESVDQSRFTAFYFLPHNIPKAKSEGWTEYFEETQVLMVEAEKLAFREQAEKNLLESKQNELQIKYAEDLKNMRLEPAEIVEIGNKVPATKSVGKGRGKEDVPLTKEDKEKEVSRLMDEALDMKKQALDKELQMKVKNLALTPDERKKIIDMTPEFTTEKRKVVWGNKILMVKCRERYMQDHKAALEKRSGSLKKSAEKKLFDSVDKARQERLDSEFESTGAQHYSKAEAGQ